MKQHSIIKWGLVVSLLGATAWALPPARAVVGNQAAGPTEIDYSRYLNANKLLGFVNNTGHLFNDGLQTFGKFDGLYYPYSSTDDILSGENTKSVVYSAGLWMGGIAANDTLIAIAEYSTEYTPGNMLGTSFDPDFMNSKYRVYILYADSMVPWYPDYANWPVDQGAPVDGGGHPLLIGKQTAWSVYNDANGARHTNDASSTAPLGIEVRQAVSATDVGADAYIITVKYQLFNKGGKNITGLYLGLWSDPDLGTPADDLVGCDTLGDLFFCYNATNTDAVYDSTPPAFGGRIVQGPIVPSQGDSAWSFGQLVHGYKNLGMTGFSKYINGLDPASKAHTYSYLQGLTRDGSPYMYEGNFLRYVHSGDPISATGDVDANPSDRRMMASCGPLAFNPGDSQEIIVRYGVIHGGNRLESLNLLRLLLKDSLRQTECTSLTASVNDYGSLVRVERSASWLGGVNWGGEFFQRSTTYGDEFWGSRLHHVANPDSFVNVQILFSPIVRQKAYRYLGPDYNYAGYEWVPFTVWDTDHQRKLNVAFVEYPSSRTFNQTWDLDDYDHLGGREYLFIFGSPYPGDLALPLAEYTSRNLKADADQLDVLYGAWLCLSPWGGSMSDLKHGDRLYFDVQNRNQNGPVSTVALPVTDLYWWSGQKVAIACQTEQLGSFEAISSDSVVFSLRTHAGYDSASARGRVESVREMSNSSGPVLPPRDVRGSGNSTGDWYVALSDGNPYGHLDAHDWEIRFSEGGSVYYLRTPATLGPGRVPFELWDIGIDTPDDPSDDRRVSVVTTDPDGSSSWTFGDRIYSYELPYTETPPSALAPTWTDSCRIGSFYFQKVWSFGSLPATGTVVRFSTYKKIPTVPPLGLISDHSFRGPQTTAFPSESQNFVEEYDIYFTPKPGHDSVGVLLLKDKLTGLYRGAIDIVGHVAGSCCAGLTGNVDCDPANRVDISDLTMLIDYLYISLSQPCCIDASRLDGPELPDIGDLTALIDFLYISFTPLPNCP